MKRIKHFLPYAVAAANHSHTSETYETVPGQSIAVPPPTVLGGKEKLLSQSAMSLDFSAKESLNSIEEDL